MKTGAETGQIQPQAKNWSDPYRALVTGKGFQTADRLARDNSAEPPSIHMGQQNELINREQIPMRTCGDSISCCPFSYHQEIAMVDRQN